MHYHSIEEIRSAFYPNMAKFLDLPKDAIIQWPHFHYDNKRGRYPCTKIHHTGKH